MISEVLVALRNRLDAQLRLAAATPDAATAEKVVFLDGEKMDPMSFKLGMVTLLVVNVEEERVLRDADVHQRIAIDGVRARVNPDVRLNLMLLFVARFKQYEQAWDYLSQIIRFFQSQGVLDHEQLPELPESVSKLVVELVTLDLAEQNELWSGLRTTVHPSLLYRLRMLVFRDEARLPAAQVRDKQVRTSS
jgi:hypothetical protein